MTSVQRTLALALLALPSIATAQFTTPPGFLTTEGMHWQNLTNTNGHSFVFGSYQSCRYQMIDGELKGQGNQTLKSVGYRLDYSSYTTATGLGRQWSNVRLTLSAGDHARMTRTFSQNVLSTPTLVFNGSVNWPDVTGLPSSKPAQWTNQYDFPFGTGGSASRYVYDSKHDLCLDYTFAGGVLHNRRHRPTWQNPFSRFYFLDGVYVRTAQPFYADTFTSIGNGRGTCSDSSSTRMAKGWVSTTLHGPATTSNPAWRGKAVVEFLGSDTAPSSFIMHALSFKGSTTGTPVPSFGCYNLMIDMAQVQLITRLPTDVIGWSKSITVPIGDLKTLAPLGKSVSFWAQAAWNDSKTGQVKLTAATRCTPDFATKLNSTTPKKRVIYQPTGSAQVSGPAMETPITRFR